MVGMSDEYSGTYLPTKYLEGNRPVFQKEGGKCIWWHYQYRHWWVGPCENVGSNAGFAYLEEDFICPFGEDSFLGQNFQQTWRKGGSDDIIDDVTVGKSLATGQFTADAVLEQTASAAVNAISRNGRYQQKCRFVYNNGNYRCRKS